MATELVDLIPEEVEYQKAMETPALEAATEVEQPVTEPEQPAKEAEKPPKGYVPQEALHQERESRKQAKREFEEYKRQTEQRFSVVEQLRREIEERRQQTSVPDKQADPLAYIEYENAQLKENINYLVEKHNAEQQNKNQSSQQEQLISKYRNDAFSFIQQNNDFSEAYNYLMDARTKEYQALGYNITEAQEIIAQEELAIVQRAYQDETNPAERIFALAKVRGYTIKEKPNSDLSTVKAGIEKTSAMNKGAAAVESKSSLEHLLSLSDEEFDRQWAKLSPPR